MNQRLLIVLTLALALPLLSAADKDRDKLTAEVSETVALFKKSDSSLNDFFARSAGYAVFPKVAKGGFGVGAATGKGQLFEQGKVVGRTGLTQVTVGLQLGGQVYSEIIFFEDQKILKDFKDGNVEFSAQLSAVAAAEGAAKNAKFKLGVAVFTLARGGLMYEASVGGQKFSYTPYAP
jgi:lipid-binding SYLF domain-containing protein